MSVVVETLVFCDSCGDNCGGDDRSFNARHIRANRKKGGWVQRGAKDYCPNCAVKFKKPQSTERET
jgi:hypothetical protein